jgi:nicotinamide riboside kinase
MLADIIRIALLGAESTGKTRLSIDLAQALQAMGFKAVAVPELLREWCDTHGRTPQQHEQADIAAQQAERIFAVPQGWVIADTSPLMTAVYSDYVFQDKSLYANALAHQSRFDLTLVMGLDIAWQADGLQRDGAHVREPVDDLLRNALASANLPFKVIYGQSEARLNAALMAIQEGLDPIQSMLGQQLGKKLASFKVAQSQREVAQYGLNQGKIVWRCDLCSDADCEHKLFSDLLKSDDAVK